MRTGDGTHFVHIRDATKSNPNPNSGQGQLTTTNGVGGTAVHYFELGAADDGITSVFITWRDATSSAALVLETTNLPLDRAAITSTSLAEWYPETVTITGPTASAAGSFMLHLGNNGVKRNRLKVTAAANTQLEIWPHGIH